MKYIPSYLIVCLLLLSWSCQNNSKSAIRQSPGNTDYHTETQSVEIKDSVGKCISDTTRTSLQYACLHFFSDPVQKDSFKITLSGASILKSKIVFVIKNHTGKNIFNEEFPAIDLLGDMDDTVSIKHQESSIRSSVAHFLDEENFLSVAIQGVKKIEEDFPNYEESDQDDWSYIKKDQTAVIFVYSPNENTYGMVFSKKKKKIIRLFVND